MLDGWLKLFKPAEVWICPSLGLLVMMVWNLTWLKHGNLQEGNKIKIFVDGCSIPETLNQIIRFISVKCGGFMDRKKFLDSSTDYCPNVLPLLILSWTHILYLQDSNHGNIFQFITWGYIIVVGIHNLQLIKVFDN